MPKGQKTIMGEQHVTLYLVDSKDCPVFFVCYPASIHGMAH